MKKILATDLMVGDRFVYAVDTDFGLFDPGSVKTVIAHGSAIASLYPSGAIVVHTSEYLDECGGIFLLGDGE